MTRDELIARLIAERKRQGIGQGVLAIIMGRSQSAVSGWECGTVRPTLDSLREWAFALRVPFPEELAVAELVAAESQCGTTRGYQRHRRRGERQCLPCRLANARYSQDYRAKRRTLQEAS